MQCQFLMRSFIIRIAKCKVVVAERQKLNIEPKPNKYATVVDETVTLTSAATY